MLRRFYFNSPKPGIPTVSSSSSSSCVRFCHHYQQNTYSNNNQEQSQNRNPSSSTTSSPPFYEIYERVENDLQIPILKALQRMKQQQNSLQLSSSSSSSSKIPTTLPPSSISLVSSAVIATPSSCSCGHICTCPPILRFTGVNSALHRQVHYHPSVSSSSSSSRQEEKEMMSDNNNNNVVIRGLLKGCAEQNALGAFAASGNHFEQVRGIVICSLHLKLHHHRQNDGGEMDVNKNKSTSSSSSSCCFPCTACRNYLSKVYKFVSDRHRHQNLKLSCVSLKVEDEFLNDDEKDDRALLEKGSGNNYSSSSSTVSLDCINGWKTSYREEVVIRS